MPNPRLCKALLDCITDRAHIIETGTESYRFRRTLEKAQGPKLGSEPIYHAATAVRWRRKKGELKHPPRVRYFQTGN
jgi:hypothetical protein